MSRGVSCIPETSGSGLLQGRRTNGKFVDVPRYENVLMGVCVLHRRHEGLRRVLFSKVERDAIEYAEKRVEEYYRTLKEKVEKMDE